MALDCASVSVFEIEEVGPGEGGRVREWFAERWDCCAV